ncbi:alpha/beta fold hydrolase [Actinacidiphila alni]|uniref:alpha/beta fold hydrolase n=1 Tax=Actinacidiphila alni TaxID=380248 RepID=UPI003451BBFD
MPSSVGPRRPVRPTSCAASRVRPGGGGFAATLDRVGWLWRSTMRLADPLALHRSACALVRGTQPTMRAMLEALPIPRTFLVGGLSPDVVDRAGLVAAGVEVVTVPHAGHCLMFDNPRAYAAAIAGGSGGFPGSGGVLGSGAGAGDAAAETPSGAVGAAA